VLYNRTFDHIELIAERGGIDLTTAGGGPNGFGKFALVTSDLEAALKDAEVIMVVLPSSAHADIARQHPLSERWTGYCSSSRANLWCN
jgi:opine dehydrogenase